MPQMEGAWLQAYVGQLAGIGTSLLWTVTTLFFTAAGRRVGATVVNATRIVFACILLGLTHRWLQGIWIPDVPMRQAVFLAFSGLLGLTIGDQAIIAAFVEIGPRIALLVTTTSPLWATLFAYVFLGEQLPATAWIGMTLTLGGILWVIGERRPGASALPSHRLVRGILLALLAAVCQSGGYLLSKMGMGHAEGGQAVRPQTAALVRMFFAAATVVPLVCFHLWAWERFKRVARPAPRSQDSSNRVPREQSRADWRTGIIFSLCGAVTGPYLGVWLSLVACDRAPLGVAQTLLTLSPVFILPATAILHRERISLRSAMGALLAVAGAAMLFGAKASNP